MSSLSIYENKTRNYFWLYYQYWEGMVGKYVTFYSLWSRKEEGNLKVFVFLTLSAGMRVLSVGL